jgi:hypothetical protein
MPSIPKPSRAKKKRKKLQTIGKLKKKVQILFNAFIRQRDSKDGFFRCISCGQIKGISHMQAGHYIPVSKSQYLRYSFSNVHGECDRCNCFDEFHLVPYRRNLIAKIGLDKVEELEAMAETHKIYKHTREELIMLADALSQSLSTVKR